MKNYVLLSVIAVSSLLGSAAQATVYYVSTHGDNENDGLSWATAKATPRAALDAASNGDETWIAAGFDRRQNRDSC